MASGRLLSPQAPARGRLRPRAARLFRAGAAVLGLLLLPAIAAAQGYYMVAPGETLDSIARKYRVPAYEIAKANNLNVNARPAAGTRLYIPRGSSDGTRTSPAPERSSLSSSSARTGQPLAGYRPRSSPPPQSRRVVVQPGGSLWAIAKDHGITVADLAAANGLSPNAGLEVGQTLSIPRSSGGGGAPAASTRSRSVANSSVSSSARSSLPASGPSGRVSARGYQWPVEGRLLRGYSDSSKEKHAGLDIAVPVGTPIRAANGGKVVFAGKIPTYGNMVIVMHTGGIATCYAWNSEILVREDQRVSRGDIIARSGDPRNSNEPYVHFQIRKRGEAINPLPWLP